MALNIVKNYLKNNRCYQQNTKCTKLGIQLHTIGTGQGTAQSVADYWNQSSISACVHYIVDCDTAGKVLQLLDEDVRSWADAGYGNNNLITFEICESDYIKYTSGANYTVSNETKFKADIMRGYNTAVQLCAKTCKERNWNPTAKLANGLYLISSHDEGRRLGVSSAHVDPTHIWPRFGLDMDKFRADVKSYMSTGDLSSTTSTTDSTTYYRVGTGWQNGVCVGQIGAYTVKDNAFANCPNGYKVFDPDGNVIYTAPEVTGTQATVFASLSEKDAATKILEMARADGLKYGILPSVTAAQMILESGYAKTELAVQANNCFGMKTSLSGNTWSGTTWDGTSKYTKKTAEEYTAGTITYITADFRKYPKIEDSIGDHSAYLLGAMNGTALRYAGLTKAKTYKDAITLVKNGGYATDNSYISKICDIITRFGLDAYDAEVYTKHNSSTSSSTDSTETTTTATPKYTVGTYVNCSSYYSKSTSAIKDAVIKSLSGTITKVDTTARNPYQIDSKYWVNDGDIRSTGKTSTAFTSYQVKVTTSDLRIRVGAGTSYVSKGYVPKGIYTITEEKQSGGYTWGKLKSGEGWIALEYTSKV